MKTRIIVNLQYAAIHNWPNCNIEKVNYLKHPHRHVFHITCKKEVKHDDRDIEIIMLKEQIERHLRLVYNGDLGGLSCEMLAKVLMTEFALDYCSVLEDGENGAEVIKTI